MWRRPAEELLEGLEIGARYNLSASVSDVWNLLSMGHLSEMFYARIVISFQPVTALFACLKVQKF